MNCLVSDLNHARVHDVHALQAALNIRVSIFGIRRVQLPLEDCEYGLRVPFDAQLMLWYVWNRLHPFVAHHAQRLNEITNMHFRLIVTAVFTASTITSAGPATYGLCQAGCSSLVMACYGAAGFTWGATLGATAPATVVACNFAFGTCQASCAAALLSPTP
ncbi:hypothetical protein MRB53_038312 [Persea americana]|nr:hypothetical protein MRB53_038312 [Persea americana]